MKPLTPANPHAIIMVGIPGAGKSTFAERFADTFQAPILNRTSLAREYGLDDEATDRLSQKILAEYLKTRRTILLEGGVDRRAERSSLFQDLAQAGYSPLLVWVQTDSNESKRRATRPFPKGSGLTEADFDAEISRFQAPNDREKPVVISGKHTYATQLKVVLKHLAMNSDRPSDQAEGLSRPGAVPVTPERPRSRGNIVIR